MNESTGHQLSLNELFAALYAGRKEAIARGSEGHYSKLIAEVSAWSENRQKHRIPVDPDEKKPIGYWYAEFDQLSFFIRSDLI